MSCAPGLLMIVLDVTVVNARFRRPDDLVLHIELAGGQRLPDRLRGLLLLAGRFGDLVDRRSVLLVGLAIFTTASMLCGSLSESDDARARAFRAGRGGAMTSA